MSDERDFLQRSLADLELERDTGDLADADFHDLKAQYERKLSRLSATSEAPVGVPRRRVRAVAVAVIVVGVGIGTGLAVARSSGSRPPGATITGSVPSTSAEQLARAAELFSQGDAVAAFKVYDAVLAENPDDVEALTYQGWQWRNIGVEIGNDEFIDRGIRLIERATTIDPTFAEAWLFRGIIYYRDEEAREQAVAALKLALAGGPRPEVAAAARELLSEIEQATSPTVG